VTFFADKMTNIVTSQWVHGLIVYGTGSWDECENSNDYHQLDKRKTFFDNALLIALTY
jgi:hypothetical protein